MLYFIGTVMALTALEKALRPGRSVLFVGAVFVGAVFVGAVFVGVGVVLLGVLSLIGGGRGSPFPWLAELFQ
jgi:hypothetical protein